MMPRKAGAPSVLDLAKKGAVVPPAPPVPAPVARIPNSAPPGQSVVNMGEAARWYAKNGIPVFPLHYPVSGRCSCGQGCGNSAAKHPLTPNGFKDATTDVAQVTAWWRQWPDANIGIPTGAVSGILVMDCDPRNGGPPDRDEIIRRFGPIPETAEVITGGDGRHIYFRDSGGPVPREFAKGVDLKGDGGYVVAPPSLHISGKRYEVDGLVGAKAFLNIADTPEWLKKAIAAHGANNHTKAEAAPSGEKWGKGERNNKLTSEAGSMRRRGHQLETILAALLQINKLQCDPPLPEGEVRQIAESVSRYEPEDIETHRTAPEKEEPPAAEWSDVGGAGEGAGEATAGRPGTSESRPQRAPAGSLVTVCASDIDPKRIHWLWKRYFARGKVGVIAGHPGEGKTQIAINIAAIVTTGGQFPDGTGCEPGNVVFLTAEDDAADTLIPRLKAAGADLSRAHIIKSVIVGYSGDGTRQDRMFSLATDVQALSRKIDEIGNVALVVIDPISAYLGKTDSHKNSEVRGVLAPLGEMAAGHNVAIIAITHLNKASAAKALMRIIESVAFVALARSVFLVTPDPEDKERRLFLPVKNNIAKDTGGLAFRIEEVTVGSPTGPIETSRVAWEPEPVTITADEAMQREEPPKDDSKLNHATGWLHLALVNRPVSAAGIYAMAKAEGIAEKTLQRASKLLNVQKEKPGMTGGWLWSLPSTKMAKSIEDGQDGQDGKSDHLREARLSSETPRDEDGQHSAVDHLDDLDHLRESWPSSEGPVELLDEEVI